MVSELGGVKVPGTPPGAFLTVSAENIMLMMTKRSDRITVKYLIGFSRVIKIQKIPFFLHDFSTSVESGGVFSSITPAATERCS